MRTQKKSLNGSSLARFYTPLEDGDDSLETVGAGAASEDERGQHGQCCKNPLHI
jgi:hypothetical protein